MKAVVIKDQEKQEDIIFLKRLKFESDILKMESERLYEVYEKLKAAHQRVPNDANKKKMLFAHNKYDMGQFRAWQAYREYSSALSRDTWAFIRSCESIISLMRADRVGTLKVVFKKSN